MRVAVCVVGFRNADDVLRCVEHLSRSTHEDYEVVLCENGGDAAHAELAARLPTRLPGGQPVLLLDADGNPGFAGGVNRCIRAAPHADAWWALNPDAAPDARALEQLVARLDRGDCDAAGGVLHGRDGRIQNCGGRWRGWLARAEAIGRDGRVGEPIDARAVEVRLDYLSGASMLVGRRFVETAGLMRDDYFLYCEEVEWFLRARRLGLRLGFAPDALVMHDQGGTTGSAHAVAERPRLPIYLDERNKLHVIRDTAPGRLPVAAVAALGLGVLRFARRGAWRQWGWATSGWLAGLLGRRGPPAWLAGARR